MTSRRFGGLWTEQKLEILRAYLDAYTTALKKQPFTLIYVDGFAGTGSYAESADDYGEFREFRQGSTHIALEIDDKPFDKLVFVEKDAAAAASLLELTNEFPGRQIEVLLGDANAKVPEFCLDMGGSDRAVVFLDPYATQVSWKTIEAIAQTKKIDCWILFPLMAVTRMMPTDREPEDFLAVELDRIFGGRQHWRASYQDSPQLPLLDDEIRRERGPSERMASLYRKRLGTAFHSVSPNSRTLRNSKRSPLFELFFAVGNPRGAQVATDIANHILKRW